VARQSGGELQRVHTLLADGTVRLLACGVCDQHSRCFEPEAAISCVEMGGVNGCALDEMRGVFDDECRKRSKYEIPSSVTRS